MLPGSYTGRRVVRAENAPPRVFRVIIEAGPATQGQPRLISSCGEKPLDELALQFTSASLQGSKELREMASKKVAVFRIQMHAPSAANSSYQGSKTREVANENALFYTPKPPYPRQARKEDDKGTGLVRVEWLPGQKKPAYVFMENSIGSALLDTSTLQWAVLHWERSQTEAALVKRIPITYRLTPGRRARPNF
ncbi:MAG: hypothetical protein JSR82_07700 [Verrucomicrobia bacterium]|nr:hypothetical protein [Verrucomicrobiota bacterium]